MEMQRSLDVLPLDLLIDIVSYLPMTERIACRSVCGSLLQAEYAQPKVHLSEVSIFRSTPTELTLIAENKASSVKETPWFSCRSSTGAVPKQWREWGSKYRQRELMTIAHHHIWCWEEAKLGRTAGALTDLASTALIDVLKLNQLTLTDSISGELQEALTGASINTIFATFNCNLKEPEKLLWLTTLPSRGLTLYTRCKQANAVFPFTVQFLSEAAANLSRVILHAKSDNGSTAATTEVVTDALLLSLLSDQCSCLRLLFSCSSLTAAGILAAIEHIRSLPGNRGFTVYAKSDVAEQLLQAVKRPDGPGYGRVQIDAKKNERFFVKDLWMDVEYREIRYFHSAHDDVTQLMIDDSENSFFRPI